MDSFKLYSGNNDSKDKQETNKGRQNITIGSFIVSLIIMAISFWYFFGGGLEKQAAKTMDNVYSQVVADSIEQY